MKSYDKAAWHIDSGQKASEVIKRFREVFEFLDDKGMLNENGKETLKYGMDSSVTLNSTMVTREGCAFLDACYDYVISKNEKEIRKNLSEEYKIFRGYKKLIRQFKNDGGNHDE